MEVLDLKKNKADTNDMTDDDVRNLPVDREPDPVDVYDDEDYDWYDQPKDNLYVYKKGAK